MFSEPVIGDKFFGREEVLEILSKRVLALRDGYRQNVALTGQCLAGKTSILQHFLQLIREEGFVTVYVEVIREPFRNFANKFVATLLYNALGKLGEVVSVDLENLLDRAHRAVPKTAAAIKQVFALIDRGELDDAYTLLLSLTSTLKDEISISCIVILDEFDNLEHVGVRNPFLAFGKVIMVQKDTMYIVSSSRDQAIKKILSEKLSLLFGNFEIVRIPGFDMPTTTRFLDSRLSGFDIEPSMRKLMMALTGGNPFYLNAISSCARTIAVERMTSAVDADLVAEVLLRLVYASNGPVHQYLMNYVLDILDTKCRDAHLSILVSMALGKNKQPEIARHIRMTRGETSKHLGKLVELGLVAKAGVFFTIEDPMLAFWLANVYQRRRSLLVDGIIDKNELFRADLGAYIAAFQADASSDATLRIADLFGRFSNELALIDGRHQRLPHFTKVDVRPTASGTPLVAASFRGRYWIVQAFEHEVNESDIVEYIRAAKSLPVKIATKLIVPLGGIDEMAKLLAKELRISIWDLGVINMLLPLYGKKRIVLL